MSFLKLTQLKNSNCLITFIITPAFQSVVQKNLYACVKAEHNPEQAFYGIQKWSLGAASLFLQAPLP